VLERVRDQFVEHDRDGARAARGQRRAAVHVAPHAIAGAEHIECAIRNCAGERRQLHFTRMRQQGVLECSHAAQPRDRDVERLGQPARRDAVPLQYEQRLNRREIISHAMLQLAQQQRRRFGVAPRALVETAVLRGELRQRRAQSNHFSLGVPDPYELFDAIGDVGGGRRRAQPHIGRRTVRPLPRRGCERDDRQERHLEPGLEPPRDGQHNWTRSRDDHRFHVLVYGIHCVGRGRVRDAKVESLERPRQCTRRRCGARVRFGRSHDDDARFGHV